MLICPCEVITTYRDSYRKFPKDNVAKKADEILRRCKKISTEEKDDNRVEGNDSPERKIDTPPGPKFGVKEYKEYLRSLECFKKEIFKIYFRCPNQDVCRLERQIEKLEKDVYEVIFYPKLYEAPTKERQHLCCKYPWDSGNRDLFGAIYRGFYYRVEELFRYRDILYNMARISDRMQQEANLKKLSKTGTSTYYDDICIPAIKSSEEKKLKTSPIDRFTLRRV